MEITYDWNFNPLECYPTSSGESDVVFLVHWQAYANTGSYNSSCIGTQMVPLNSSSAFIPFEQLTKEVVYGWVTQSMGQERFDAIQTSLYNQIQSQINPPVLTLQAPWLPTGSI